MHFLIKRTMESHAIRLDGVAILDKRLTESHFCTW
jgi:hypothetical protein